MNAFSLTIWVPPVLKYIKDFLFYYFCIFSTAFYPPQKIVGLVFGLFPSTLFKQIHTVQNKCSESPGPYCRFYFYCSFYFFYSPYILFFTLKNSLKNHPLIIHPELPRLNPYLYVGPCNPQQDAVHNFLIFITHKRAREQWYMVSTQTVPFQFNGIVF